MKKYSWLILLVIFLGTSSCLKGANSTKLKLALEWQLNDGKVAQRDFGTVEISRLTGRGCYVAFQSEKGQTFPGLSLAGEWVLAKVAVERMKSLELVVTVSGAGKPVTERSLLFSKTRPWGSKTAAPENVYHLLVLENFITSQDLPASLTRGEAPQPQWAESFWRTHRLALNYATQSDAKTRRYEQAFGVKAVYDLPRLVLVAEEWLDLPEAAAGQKKPATGDLFGGALDEVGAEIAGEQKPVTKKIPIYSIDLLLDQVSAVGKHPRGFQTARSIANDLLEGEVIYQAGGGKRRVITASIIFAQLEKERQSGRQNQLLLVDMAHINLLDRCEKLWPAAKAAITSFLQQNPEWQVVIPRQPVVFYQGQQPLYALYGWYQVEPASGRIKGILPNGARGACSDELARLEQTLLEKTKEKVGSAPGGSPVKALFSQVAGMYVASAGVLDAVGLTICDPTLANLSDADWRRFVASHALDFCQKFLEEHADLYDSYEAQLGFWQGSMLITSELGGITAARDCANRALTGMTNKVINDTKSAATQKLQELKGAATKQGRQVFDQVVAEYSPRLNQAITGLEEIEEFYDQGQGWVDQGKDALNRYNNAVADLEQQLRKQGLL